MKNRNMESNLSCTFAERQTDQEVSCISVSLHSFDVPFFTLIYDTFPHQSNTLLFVYSL